MKRVLLPAGAVVATGLVLAIMAGELGLRLTGFSAPIWYQPDPQLGWAMRPNARGWFTKEGRAYAEINPAGFRDRAHALEKSPAVFRVTVLGDSVVEAFQVDLKAAFWWQLQERLRSCAGLRGRDVEVLAFGVSGYGTAQQHLLLESTVIRYQPDVVLLAFAPNDVRNNSKRLEPENLRPFFLPDGKGLKLDASFTKSSRFLNRSSPAAAAYRSASDRLRLVQLVQAARHGIETWRQARGAHAQPARAGERNARIEPTTITALFAPPRDAAWEEAWTVTERLVARMNESAAGNNARLAVMLVSHSAQVHPDAAARKRLQDALGVEDLFYIERRMQALGKREGILVVPLAPELQKRAEAHNAYFHGFRNYRMGWGHWNEDGHRAAAAIVARRLCSEM